MRSQLAKFLDYSLYADSLNKLPDKQPLLVNTINQYSYCVAETDAPFKKALQESDVLLPDGIAVVLATKLLTGQKIKKIAGADIHQHYLKRLNQTSGSCFYLGSSNETLKKIQTKISKEYPNVKVAYFSPPYKSVFNKDDINNMINVVNTYNPDVLFVGMTAPKQEKWAHANKQQLQVKVICTIGAVFDFYAGTVKRPHNIWINLGLEWFIRLINEPKRMWKRYLYYGPVFIYEISRHKLKKV